MVFFNLQIPKEPLMMHQAVEQDIAVLPFAEVSEAPAATQARRRLKRLLDITFSLIVILILFPVLFPLLYIAIRLDSAGGAFFVQKRNGLNNKVFSCFKFRTMIINKDADYMAARAADGRITRVGKILRVSGLDELPQFINVLLGQMSIVGPRPHMVSDNLRFARLSEQYHRRSLVKPGITGLAQVRGFKGDPSDERSIRKRTALDLIYVDNYNLLLDLKIIAATAGMMIRELFKLTGK